MTDHSPDHAERATIVAAHCATCGVAFEPIAYNVSRGRGKYCSRPCARKAATEASKAKPKATDEAFVASFWDRVERAGKDQCWPWIGPATVKKDGRGIHCFGGRRMLAPRVAFFAQKGRWLSKEEMACHSCDNPACCNPKHIWSGSAADNARDMAEKGRSLKPFCSRGHLMSGPNLRVTPKGKRYCHACSIMRNRSIPDG